MLDVEQLTSRYGSITAIREVSLRVGTGEVVGLIGPNGAGKTTLLASVAGLVSPASGRVAFEGQAVTGRSPDHLLRLGLASGPTGGRRQALPQRRGPLPAALRRRAARAVVLSGARARARSESLP